MFYKYVNLLIECQTADGLKYLLDKICDLYDNDEFSFDEYITLCNLQGKLLNLIRKTY